MISRREFIQVAAATAALSAGVRSGLTRAVAQQRLTEKELLAFIRARVSVPVLTGLPFGHVKERCTLPFGAPAHLRSDAAGFDLTVTDYPLLRR